jgi:hypothetical protein
MRKFLMRIYIFWSKTIMAGGKTIFFAQVLLEKGG